MKPCVLRQFDRLAVLSRPVDRHARCDQRRNEPALDDVLVVLDRPPVVGKTSPASLFGHTDFDSRSALTTIGVSGTVRSPASDFGFPIALYRSARCLT